LLKTILALFSVLLRLFERRGLVPARFAPRLSDIIDTRPSPPPIPCGFFVAG
jgi:hypothetical protein